MEGGTLIRLTFVLRDSALKRSSSNHSKPSTEMKVQVEKSIVRSGTPEASTRSISSTALVSWPKIRVGVAVGWFISSLDQTGKNSGRWSFSNRIRFCKKIRDLIDQRAAGVGAQGHIIVSKLQQMRQGCGKCIFGDPEFGNRFRLVCKFEQVKNSLAQSQNQSGA